MKRSGIFVKVFIYTIILSTVLVGLTVAMFSTRFITYYSRLRYQEITSIYQSIVVQSQGEEDITEVARQFYEKNQSMQFYIKDKDGQIVYATPEANVSGIEIGTPPYSSTIMLRLDNDYLLYARKNDLLVLNYDKWIAQALFVLSVMIAVCIISSFVFSRKMTKPIKTLAYATNKMANNEEVQPLPERRDELGILASDVYSMYRKLKETISQLEDEIQRERELEEAQRYFFSAASHELKTPIAATSVLLEGMLENVGDYMNHPKYLRECMKMMDVQNKVISEILEIVNLNNGNITPVPEKLDVRHTILEMLPDFQIMTEANDQQIIMDIPDKQSCLIDRKMFQKVFSNIMLNAVQNTPQGGEIRLRSDTMTNHYRLCVLNTKAKIDDTVLPKLFDPFYRVDKARSRKSGRSGLGLTIVKKTLKAMEIDFMLENTPDGVLFWMDLPKG